LAAPVAAAAVAPIVIVAVVIIVAAAVVAGLFVAVTGAAAADGDHVPAHRGVAVGIIDGGVDVRTDGQVGIADGDGRFENRLERLADVELLRGAADEHGHG